MTDINNQPELAAELRRRAEKVAQSSESPEALSPEETRKMLHELRVHQVELEMQNEELRQAQAELDAVRARYFDLYDLAPVGYITLSEKGVILEGNLAAAIMLEVTRGEMVKQPITLFIHKEDQDIYYRHCKRLFGSDSASVRQADEPHEFELRMVKRNGTALWARLEATTVQDTNGAPACRVVISDITERKRIEEVQAFLAQTGSGKQTEPFFLALARFLAKNLDMYFVCIDRLEGDGLTARTVSVWCDGHFEDNVTYALKDTPCGEVVGKTVCCFPAGVCQIFPHDQVLQDLRAESYVGVTLWSHTRLPIGLIAVIGRNALKNKPLAEATLKLVAGRAAGELERLDAEEALQRANDELEQRVAARTEELQQANEELQAQITERKRAEETLRFLSARLLTSQEEEKRRLAMELHDQTSQDLIVVKLHLAALQNRLRKDQSILKKECDKILTVTNGIIEDVRRLFYGLSPNQLETIGLCAALAVLFRNFSEKTRIPIRYDIEALDKRFPMETQIVLYRIFQEALTNTHKHARAKTVRTDVSRQDNIISIKIQDDGHGFDPCDYRMSEPTLNRGMGLSALELRAHMIGAELKISSQRGQGTEINLLVPINGNRVKR